MKNVFLALTLCVAAVAQTKTAPPKAAAPKATSKVAPKAAAPKAATKAPAVRRDLMNPATMTARAPAVFFTKLNTTKGEVIIKVTRAWAPNGADRFYNLVRAGFFTNVAFFRVLSGFMAQFGISPRPDVARVWANANIVDDPVKASNTRGMVTFAQSSARNSRSTQFFINYANNSRLDPDRFAPFGEVIQGMDVVDKFYSGYGEQPDQGLITAQGKAYLDKNFPRLDRILTATVIPDPDAPKDTPKNAPKK
jgi:peptidyl-prolyl cis-trans isomerase A (cyclophilin A)